ncbi:CatB-related O-acetyltransferase [Anaerosalibacter bizertensis]|uniref:CatB-related O-acetyltransferase n=1 Tax=Anaerosalibacter bizertensis TaxID=932217 RepID=A0A844FJZ1_9FIRM|nr:CatB-related O-acetyltransferase [Anaerosalibacter bizertensis]MSS44404.1 CatB-related O-acetyltransferase [Anaerosalibacter bizertensis]
MGRIIKQLKCMFQSIFIFKKKKIRISPLAYYDDVCVFKENIYIDRFCNLHNVKMDEYSYVGYRTSIGCCTIGKYCSIGADVKIGLGKHPTNYISTSPIFYTENNCLGVKLVQGTYFKQNEEVIIGNDVWIGSNAIIMGGVKIGHGAIIGSGAVVTRDVEPYAIVGGVPARIIRYRFTKEKIEDLLNIKWWDWDREKIIENIDNFRAIERIIK